MTDRRPWVSIPPLPQTTTILALGFLAGLLLFTPMIAMIGERVPPEFREDVREIVKLIRDGMLLILGFYFAKVVNSEQRDMVNRAFDAAAGGSSSPATADAKAAAVDVAEAARREAAEIAARPDPAATEESWKR
jgi:4-hydroxybenzoate polyprenyltransferase